MPASPFNATASTDQAPAQDAPDWFTAALSAPVEIGEVAVAGVPISYRGWGERGTAGVLLVHGGAAHARWWDHIAPLLASAHRVVAIDLSGHGDSGRREVYSLDLWADELMAVTADGGIAGAPIVVGHSMGGFVTLRAATRFGDALAGAITVDSPIRALTPEEEAAARRNAFGPLRIYPSRDEILKRFRPIPDQDALPYVRRHVAENSVRAVAGGWSWKFDPQIFGRARLAPSVLTRLECRVALFRAEHGLVSADMGEMIYQRLGRVAPVIEIPGAGHAIMLDQPLALLTGIRTLLADWQHSLPPNGQD
ncbi:MAG TPA: alpha/beta hydrolase [Jatrophihabitans sp.]|jgi:pimeloyl-ACP methyl ester carboxylesterase